MRLHELSLPGGLELLKGPASQQIEHIAFGRAITPYVAETGPSYPAWQTVAAFTNSWVSVGSPYAPAGYCIDATGVVRFCGLISTGAIGSAAFTLPAGYRPAYTRLIATGSSSNFGMVAVDPAGVVTPFVGYSSWFSLDGVSFEIF